MDFAQTMHELNVVGCVDTLKLAKYVVDWGSPGIPERPSSFDLVALVFALLHKKFEDAHAAEAGARQISPTEPSVRC
jgi:hypothetical protein